jgi:hypothetical protein
VILCSWILCVLIDTKVQLLHSCPHSQYSSCPTKEFFTTRQLLD